MKVRPATNFLGCCSLFLAVEVISLLVLVNAAVLIALSSSAYPLQVLGLTIEPNLQMILATWSFVGIPIAISAGVGALYRIEHNVKLLFWYLLFSLPLAIAIPAWLLLSGSVCSSVVDREVQRMGVAFVCGFADTFVLMWMLLGAMIHLYTVHIVWSAGEEMATQPVFPELQKYANKLKNLPIPQGQMPEPAIPFMAHPNYPMTSQTAQVPSFNGDFQGHHLPALAYQGVQPVQAGSPQSFFPMPSSSIDYAGSQMM